MRLSSLRPAYLRRRIGQILFQRAHPDAPWLTESGILLLDAWLKPTDLAVEWGSGRSTTWLAARVGRLLSVEHDRAWHERVGASLQAEGLLAKVDHRHVPCALAEAAEPESHPYCDVADELPDGGVDFALVDGFLRSTCLLKVIPKIRPGGLLALDNANRYVPNRYLGGHSTVHEPRDAPPTRRWAEALERLRGWRWINTTDGIWDTRFWVRPPG